MRAMTILSGHCSDSILGKRKDTEPCRSQFAEIVEHMLSNVMEEIERRLASQNECHLSTMAHVASGYQKVIEERIANCTIKCKTSKSLIGNIRVYCRVRPFLPGQANGSSAVEDVSDNTITIIATSKVGKGKKSFTFNKCFGPCSSQEEVFADTQPLIRSTGPKELTKETLGVNYRQTKRVLMSRNSKNIATLKAALARKEGGESAAVQYSRYSSPDRQGITVVLM
ncbi:hypothetical protein OROMI_017075 [Orobanche minor]